MGCAVGAHEAHGTRHTARGTAHDAVSDDEEARGAASLDPQIWTGYCPAMTAISYTAARENLAATMDKVCDDHAPIVITRNREQAVVMMSLADYEALEETAYLLKNPKNAKRIMRAVSQLEAGKGVARAVDLKA